MFIDRQRSLKFLSLPLLVACLLFVAGVALGDVPDRTDALPRRAQGIDVREHLGDKLPLQLGFTDHRGRAVTLAEQFTDGLPVILTMNYSSCPMLCSLQLDGLVKSLKASRQLMGRDYRIVTVSFDPHDTPEKLAKMRERYLGDYARNVPANAWTMLAGNEQDIRAVASAVGIKYNYNEARQEYLHPAVVEVLTPQAIVARYLYGIELNPKTVEWSLIEASNGRTASTVDRLILFCFHYDSGEGRYAPVAFNIMRLGGLLTVLLLGSVLASHWLLELRQRKRMAEVPPC